MTRATPPTTHPIRHSHTAREIMFMNYPKYTLYTLSYRFFAISTSSSEHTTCTKPYLPTHLPIASNKAESHVIVSKSQAAASARFLFPFLPPPSEKIYRPASGSQRRRWLVVHMWKKPKNPPSDGKKVIRSQAASSVPRKLTRGRKEVGR